jgi:hypothetical protein
VTNTRARHTLSAVHDWNAAATISCVRDALLVLLPSGEMADGGLIAKGNTPTMTMAILQ